MLRMKWLLSASLVLGLTPSPQAQPPIYRAGVYLVPYKVGIYPARDLTRNDVKFVVGDQEFAPAEFEPDPRERGVYFVYFAPPPALRDGKPREVFVRLRNRRSWSDVGKPFVMSFPVPDPNGAQARRKHCSESRPRRLA